ncbi:MAG: hypothetical protein RIC55_15500 [Pirellulaceae bacterium]
MRGRTSLVRWAPAALLLLLLLKGHVVHSEDAAPPLERPLRFHWVFAPRSDTQLLLELKQAKVRMERRRFEQHIAALAPSSPQPSDAHAQISRAVYRARLQETQLIEGEAQLDVSHTGEGVVWMSLGDSTLAIRDGRWEGETPAPVVLAAMQQGEQVMQVEQSGRAAVAWSLRADSDPFGELTFNTILPPCAASRLELEIPAGWRLETKQGFAARSAETPLESDGQATTMWIVELGSASDISLRVMRDEAERRQLAILRQRLTYELTPSRGALTGSLLVDAPQDPLQQLELELSPRLDLLWVRLGDQQLPLTVKPPAGDDASSRVTVHFPEPLSGAEREIRFEAVFGIETDRSWSLPEVVVHGVAWQEGVATLRVMEPLRLNQLQPQRCRQINSTSLPAPNPGQSLDVQYFSADAAIEMVLATPLPRLEVSTGTTLDVDSVAVAAEVVAEVSASEGRRYELEMSLPAAWTVESLRTEPAEALDDYDVLPRGQQPQRVRIRLRLGVSSDQADPLRILMRAHRRLPAQGATFTIDDLRLAEFTGVESVRRLIAVPAAQFQLQGDMYVERLDPLALPDADARLATGGADRIVLVDDHRADPLRLTLITERPRYTTDVEITAQIDSASLLETYRLLVRPQSSPVGRLLVHFSNRREETLQWSLSGESSLAVLAQKRNDESNSPTPNADGETWEITLQPPRSAPFELSAVRRSSGKGVRRISLLSLPQAETQSGTVSIESAGGAGVDISSEGLRAVPADLRANDELDSTRAVFRYEPSQEALLQVSPADTADLQPSLWAWSCQLTTYCGADGATHRARYFLETAGRRQLDVGLPEGCEVRQVLVDGREIRVTTLEGTRRFSVALPPDVRYPMLDVEYREDSASLPAVVGELRPRLPEIAGLPILQQQWIVWTPPGYQVGRAQDSDDAAADSIGRRLLGVLWRSEGRPFAIFSEEEWANLATDAAPTSAAERTAQRCLETLALPLGDRQRMPLGPSWSQLISAYDQQVRSAEEGSSSPPELHIDAAALAAAGVGPQTPLPQLPASLLNASSPELIGVWVLEASNLVLLATADEVLLTTRAAVQHVPMVDAKVCFGGAVVVGRPPVDASTLVPLEGRFPNSEVWASSSIGQLSPWKSDAPQAFASLADAGWQAHRFELPSGDELSFTISRLPLIEAFGWAMTLATAALAFWIAIGRPARLALLVGVVAIVALMTPSPFTPLSTGALLGVLLAGALVAAFRATRIPGGSGGDSASSSGGDTTRTLHRVAILLLAAVAFAAVADATFDATAVLAADEDPTPAGSRRPAPTPSDESARGDGDEAVADDADKSEVDRPLLYAVVVEVDEDGQPADEYVWVPTAFWAALRERVRKVDQPWHTVLLENAEYHCRMAWRRDGTLAAEQLVATLQLEVLGAPSPRSRYVVPIDCERLDLQVDDGALLDGRATEVVLTEGGRRLAIVLDQPGKHTLELRFDPRRQVEGDTASLDIGIPSIVPARLHVRFPGDVSGIQVVQALGATTFDPITGEMVADLGPVDRLQLAWSLDGGLEPKGARLDVEEMTWLKVSPGGVAVDVRYRFRCDAPIEEVQLVAEPGLRLRPIGADQPIRQWHTHDAEVKSIHLELQQPYAKEVTLDLRFLRTGGSGVGKLRLPRLRAVADRVLSRKYAVSVSPLLDFQQSERLPEFDPEQFLSERGDAAAAQAIPDFAFTLPADAEPTWSLATRPKSPASRCNSVTDVLYRQDAADVAFFADIDTSGYLFQHRLSTPTEMTIDDVSLLVDDKEAVARWSRDEAGDLTIILDRRVTGPQRLRLRGRVPVDDRRVEAPVVSVAEVQTVDSVYRVYRSPDVRTRVVSTEGLETVDERDTAVELPALPWQDASHRLVAVYRRPPRAVEAADKPAAPADASAGDSTGVKEPIACLLEIFPNRPLTKCRSVTSMRRSDGKWTIEATYRLDVSAGLLDEFWLDVPDRLVEPFEIQPETDFEVLSVPGQTRRRLVIRPAKPFRGDARLTLRASLSPSLAGERIAFPDIVPLMVEPVEQFVIVPTQDETQRYVWETSGLQAAELPSEASREDGAAATKDNAQEAATTDESAASESLTESADDAAAGGRAVWRVVAPRYSASLKLLERSASMPSLVQLADVQFSWDRDGACRGLATFDLEPAGREDCILVLPPPFRLAQVNVAGLPARLGKLAENRWRVMLGPAQLPQRVVVLFEGELPAAAPNRRVIAAPRLEDVSVVRTLWTLYAPQDDVVMVAADPSSVITAADLTAYRYAAYASLIDRAAEVALEQPRVDVDRWYLPWARRLATARENWANYLDSSQRGGAETMFTAQQIEAIDRQQNDDAQRLDVTHIRSLAAAKLGPAEIWEVAQQGRMPSLHCTLVGDGSEHLEVVVVTPPVSDVGLRLLLTPMLAGVSLLVFLLAVRGPLGAWIVRWPHAVGVLVGLAWWLWLTPSLLGWCIVLASVVSALRMPWKPSRRREPAPVSTILRRNGA